MAVIGEPESQTLINKGETARGSPGLNDSCILMIESEICGTFKKNKKNNYAVH